MRRLLLIFLLLWSAIAGAVPLVHVGSRGHVETSAEPGLETTALELQDRAEDALREIHKDLEGLPEPRTIRLQVVRDAASIASVAPDGRGAPTYAIGVAYPDLGVITVATRKGGQLVDPTQTLRHELAHIALGAALGDHAPHWLHEGFAYQHSSDFSFDRMETLAGMAWFHSIVPLDDLDRSFPAEEAPANRAYAEAYDFVGYLSRRGRYEDTADDGDREPFRAFLAGVAQTGDLDAAATKAYGRPLHVLFEEWRETLSNRYLLAPIGLLGLAVWVLCAILLALAWRRRRRQNRVRMAQWERDERAYDEMIARLEAERAAAQRPPDEPPLLN
ncbi:MAG: hypothetical protein JO257_09060 [Deltaproteobacteria bacterium]|nr:hypothetical protein [Deltaproteobacteria bacterium]